MRERVRVTIYTKPGCHLCDEAKEELRHARCRDAYTLEEINIETDPELFRRYGVEIPVIAIDGHVTFKYRVSAADFERQIKRARGHTLDTPP